MTKITLACPKCELGIAVYEDTAASVGADLAGFYVSHPLWAPYPTATKCPGYLAAQLLPKTATAEACVTQWHGFADAMRTEGDIVVARLKLAKEIAEISRSHPTHRFVLASRASERTDRILQETASIMQSYARMADGLKIVFTDEIGSTEDARLDDLPEALKGKGGTNFGDAIALVFGSRLGAGPLEFANVAVARPSAPGDAELDMESGSFAPDWRP